MKNKVSKKQFLADVATRVGLPVETVTSVYDGMLEETHDIVDSGKSLSLTGFGSFYLQKHKGHPVQFDKHDKVPDYLVFKFSASDVYNRRFRKEAVQTESV
jgi:nucleoid DNA-binding protein